MDNTIIQQGHYVADGTNKFIPLRSDIDWMNVWNTTEIAAVTINHGLTYSWQRGMQGIIGGIVDYHGAANRAVFTNIIPVNTGFVLADTSVTAPGALRAVTVIANAVAPQIDTADTTGLADGSIVRLVDALNVPSLCGWDFEVSTINPGVSFAMRYAMANVQGIAGGAAEYRVIPYDPIFYPRFRYIVNITQAANAVVSTSVGHGYTVGQKVRINIGAQAFSMVEIHGLLATITAVTANTITTDIDSTGFTAFTFALPANVPFTMPTVVPVGEDTAQAIISGVDMLGDATVNTAQIGMILQTGLLLPGGSANDVIYWQAGKSFNGEIIG